MSRYIITLLLFCCISLTALADEILLNDQHPDRHVVVKGDTLWGIAGQFLKDPWQWPKVWQLNRNEIKNPQAKQAKQQIQLPDERIGLLMVFRVFERVSYALIMQASEPVNKLDSVLSPK
jgi:LysM repeat protein